MLKVGNVNFFIGSSLVTVVSHTQYEPLKL